MTWSSPGIQLLHSHPMSLHCTMRNPHLYSPKPIVVGFVASPHIINVFDSCLVTSSSTANTHPQLSCGWVSQFVATILHKIMFLRSISHDKKNIFLQDGAPQLYVGS